MSIPLRPGRLPQRLTQLFADNKKSYEALVNGNSRQAAPETSHLHLRLRIQKDRLIAWGIQWSDRSAGHGDIDETLDKAGISDLVASIMCSIRCLLDEAEALQPRPSSSEVDDPDKKMLTPPSSFGSSASDWTDSMLKRLEEILRDLTTSIDTLCDLSKPRMGSSESLASLSKTDSGHGAEPTDSSRSLKRRGQTDVATPERARKAAQRSPPSRRDDLADMTYLDPSLLHLQRPQGPTTSSPPSYESIAAGSEDRMMARLSSPSSQRSSPRSSSATGETLVLLDYRQTTDAAASEGLPDSGRFEELLLALLKITTAQNPLSAGVLKLTGWTVDPARRRYAYAYEVPRPEANAAAPPDDLQPRSLLSFLQNGGDAESINMPCLENRFRLALNVTSSIRQLHEASVAHRNINSNNLLYFLTQSLSRSREKVWKDPWIRKPYLTGFNPMGVSSSPDEQEDAFNGLYYHPKLSGPGRVAYTLMHDYYSLGLVLLEIGLWMPIGKFWKSRYTLFDFKTRLQDIYLRKLSSKCGDGYMNAVLFCMTAADRLGQSLSLMSSVTGLDDVLAHFRRNVIKPLERCCRIEWDGSPNDSPSAGLKGYASQSESSKPQAETPGRERAFSKVSEQGTQTAELSRQKEGSVVAGAKQVQQQQPEAKLTVWSHELPALYQRYWSSTMYPKLERILRKAISRWESYSIDLFMAGDEADTARPTVYMECLSTNKVRRILRFLNEELRLFDIKVVSGQIVRSKVAKKKRKSGKKKGKSTCTSAAEEQMEVDELNPHYSEKPGCGASIGAYLNGNHLPPVTFGGAILVNGEPFGMSVHHMLEDDEEIEAGLEDVVDLRRSMAQAAKLPRDVCLEEGADDGYHSTDEEGSEADDVSSNGYACSDYSQPAAFDELPSESLYPFHMPDDIRERWAAAAEDDDDPTNDFWLSPSFDRSFSSLAFDDDDDDECDLGDTPGVAPDAGPAAPMVTQPALDDVEAGFFPCADDAAAEHLASHGFGHVHASSGLRRTRTPDAKLHEIDWALIRIHPARLAAPLNLPPATAAAAAAATATLSTPDRPDGSSTLPTAPSPPPAPARAPTAIMPAASLAARAVYAHARSAGAFACGTILPAMRLVRLPGRASAAHSWPVRGGFGAGGDSGAWVLDAATGALCGHVLAYSARSGVAYLAPMEVLVRDMERALGGAVVGLPGAEQGVAAAAAAAAGECGLVERGGWGDEEARASPACPTSPPTIEAEPEAALGILEARGLAKGRTVDLPMRTQQVSSAVATMV